MQGLKKIFLFFFVFLALLIEAQDFTAVQQLADRRFPWLKNKIVIQKIPFENNQDVSIIQTENNKLKILASSISAASRGLDWYVKKYAHQSISHLGNNVENLERLPVVEIPVKRKSFVTYRYALNYCTINYSYSFYTWEDWEQELDWMALNGVNLMLAPVGTELIWYNTMLQLGYSDSEARAFIPGPAYTAWWLMGNLEGWGGSVSIQLIKQQAELQKKILGRMNELGIEPILQGFYGMVPRSLKYKISSAKVLDQGKWVVFKRPDILDPTTITFTKIADTYYGELKKLYGNTIRFFGGEPFHEGGNAEGISIREAATDIQSVMLHNFPNSTWVLQGWQNNPSDELLKGLKKENTLIIELFGENTDNWLKRKGYNGTNFIWCNVSNFGDKSGMYGKLQRFIDEPFRIKNSEYSDKLKGVGIIPEGIYNNPVAYDLMLDLAWYDEKPDLDYWLKYYTEYRYGKYNKNIINAWQEFAQTIYNSPEAYQEGPPESIYCARPSLDIKSVSSWGTRTRNYDQERFKKAVKLFLEAEDEFVNSETYSTDKIDFLRQVLANKGEEVYNNLVASIKEKKTEKIKQTGSCFLQLINMQDQLTGNSKYFTLNRWLLQAEEFGKPFKDDQANIIYNAKTQITFWGPDNASGTSVRDYAHKEWNGLLGSLYTQRWALFIQDAIQGKITEPETFYQMEINWSRKKNMYPPVKLRPDQLLELQNEILK
ncbi:alpha-N-acetylglucosaminidase [Chryseobacterium phosphatilyticum]|uniref:Alpha-N-acetylglucosaminidase n=1 Tax=Chryseobacterium phosphatilyticum TaxID=475075 RepID=A0A316XE25_9FLAO|nr:alpha-N-acetylglucosaminidase [Chryseobacterium phosphatilyticum]PWN72071.1 alpha-N-acetylglucosaminidase [Chryseobacterium phosphatilyticum]